MRRQKGFTLIELLVVMAIIGILTVIGLSSFVGSQQRARDAARKSEMKSLSEALNAYYADNGLFPNEVLVNNLIESGLEFSNGDIIYMKKVPSDSSVGFGNHLQFKYLSSDSTYFKLYANLENEEDIDCQSNCLVSEYNVISGCCYVVTSSNIGY